MITDPVFRASDPVESNRTFVSISNDRESPQINANAFFSVLKVKILGIPSHIFGNKV